MLFSWSFFFLGGDWVPNENCLGSPSPPPLPSPPYKHANLKHSMAQNIRNFFKHSNWLFTSSLITDISNNSINERLFDPSSPLPKLRGFKIAHLNITSLTKHFDELLIYMQDKPFDILTLNEMRLDNSISDSEVKISAYDIIRRDRNRNGSGVAMYIRSNISFINRNDLAGTNWTNLCGN